MSRSSGRTNCRSSRLADPSRGWTISLRDRHAAERHILTRIRARMPDAPAGHSAGTPRRPAGSAQDRRAIAPSARYAQERQHAVADQVDRRLMAGHQEQEIIATNSSSLRRSPASWAITRALARSSFGAACRALTSSGVRGHGRVGSGRVGSGRVGVGACGVRPEFQVNLKLGLTPQAPTSLTQSAYPAARLEVWVTHCLTPGKLGWPLTSLTSLTSFFSAQLPARPAPRCPASTTRKWSLRFPARFRLYLL